MTPAHKETRGEGGEGLRGSEWQPPRLPECGPTPDVVTQVGAAPGGHLAPVCARDPELSQGQRPRTETGVLDSGVSPLKGTAMSCFPNL